MIQFKQGLIIEPLPKNPQRVETSMFLPCTLTQFQLALGMHLNHAVPWHHSWLIFLTLPQPWS